MKQKRKTMVVIIVLISAALLVLIWLQIVLLDRAFELKNQAFQQNVNSALNSIVHRLEDKEMVSKVIRVMIKADSNKPAQKIHREVKVLTSDVEFGDSSIVWNYKYSNIPRFDVEKGKFYYNLTSPQHVRLRILDTLGNEIEEVLNEYKPAGHYELLIDTLGTKPGKTVLNFLADSSSYNMIVVAGSKINFTSGLLSDEKKSTIINRILSQLTEIETQPIEARIQKAVLDSVVKTTLAENQINLPVEYGIHAIEQDTIKFAASSMSITSLKESKFRSRLFPGDPFYSQNDIVLYFPQQTMYLLKQNGILLIASMILLSIIVFFFIFTMRTIFKQKRFAILLTDFINNMTHEFKTPISTISLASEAISNPAVLTNKKKLKQYNSIIKDENTRMRNQVEKILQMAVLEEGEFELNKDFVDVHQIIRDTVANIHLQIEKRKGSISCDLTANPSIIQVDPIHFTNVINNLIDNANKYTKLQPAISITTGNNHDGIKINVSDNGIGLAQEDKKHIFDKYYRVSTGNVHDVKGFGLGLSYVKLIVEAHGGTVSLESEENKGSTFLLFMPYQKNNGKSKKTAAANSAN